MHQQVEMIGRLHAFAQELARSEKWRGRSWIEIQLRHHCDEIAALIDRDTFLQDGGTRAGVRELVDLMIIADIYLMNNLSSEQLHELLETRIRKFKGKSEK